MKDLDFDELDRAVASALGDSSSPRAEQPDESTPNPVSSSVETPAPAPASDVATDATAGPASSISAHAIHSRIMPSTTSPSRTTLQRKGITPDAAPVAEVTDEPTQSTVEEKPSSEQPKRRIPHREGRFMDVVRAGQTMPTSNPKPPVETAPSVVDTPSMPEIATIPETQVPASVETNKNLEAAINELFVSEGHDPVVSEDSATPAEVASPDVATPEGATQSLTPEPLEPETPSSTEDDSVAALAAELGSMPASESPAPMTASPFLADAKVEKRPLGVATDVHDSLEIEPSASNEPEATPSVNDLPPAPEPEPENAPIPEELASDLLAIESSTPTTPEQPKEDSVATTAVGTGPASIARQYKEQPRTASEDDESGAIFDPGTYQQPIEHPAKKSSGWGWIIAIIVIILAAVGGVVAAWLGGLLPVAL